MKCNVPLYEMVAHLRADIAGYITAGMTAKAANAQVRQESCASSKAWNIATNQISCSICGALVDISKKGNLYCVDICWKNPEYAAEREQDKAESEAAMESYHGDWGDRS